ANFKGPVTPWGQPLLKRGRVPNEPGPGGKRGDGGGFIHSVRNLQPAHHDRTTVKYRVNSYRDWACLAFEPKRYAARILVMNICSPVPVLANLLTARRCCDTHNHNGEASSPH